MGYVDKTLGRGEEIRYRAHYNWTFSFFPVVWFSLGAAPVVMYVWLQYYERIPYSQLQAGWIAAWTAFAAGSLRLLTHLVNLWTTEFVVTSYRFVHKFGWIRRVVQEVNLNKIEEVNLVQSVWGRVAGFGKLTLHGTGVGKIELKWIDNPLLVKREIENARADLRRGDRGEQSGEND
jgi:hypothetical protein